MLSSILPPNYEKSTYLRLPKMNNMNQYQTSAERSYRTILTDFLACQPRLCLRWAFLEGALYSQPKRVSRILL